MVLDQLYIEANRSNATHKACCKLILPLSQRHATRSLLFFMSPAKSLYHLTANLLNCSPVYLCEAPLLTKVKSISNNHDTTSCTYIGTPGPLNKPSILLLNPDGNPISISKLGHNHKTSALLHHEMEWLKRLAEHNSMFNHVPKLINFYVMDQCLILTQTVQQGGQLAKKWSAKHTVFVNDLHTMLYSDRSFIESRMYANLYKRFDRFRGTMNRTWISRVHSALNFLEQKLGKLNMYPAHRDFAYWNIRIYNNMIYVFDWEYAEDEYIPLYDILHFLTMPIALKGKLNSSSLKMILKRAQNIGTGLSSSETKCVKLSAQLVAYLIDVCLFYIETHGHIPYNDRIVSNYSKAIDEILSSS